MPCVPELTILKQPNAIARPRHGFKIPHLSSWGLLIVLSATAHAATATGHPIAPSSAAGLFHWRPFLAPFHSVILHFPIGFVTLAALAKGVHVLCEKPLATSVAEALATKKH